MDVGQDGGVEGLHSKQHTSLLEENLLRSLVYALKFFFNNTGE